MVASADLHLVLEGKKSLTLNETDLHVHDSPTTTIPLYNLLWAETSNGTICLNYVIPTKNHAKLEKLNLGLSTASTPNELSPDDFVAILLSRAYGQSKPGKRVLALVNPNSGPGGALQKWKNEVKPLFDAARMEVDMIVLKKGGEATEIVEKLDLGKYDAILPCSGDGTAYEVFNGLARREDAGEALRNTSVGHIPCGSGNALSLNLYGSNKVGIAALGVIKGVDMPIDLVSVTQGPRRIVSCLSQSVGIIAECDLGTENMRWMGSTRFEVGLVARVMQRKCYPCDVAVKVEVEDKPSIKAHYKRHIEDASLMAINGDAEAKEKGLPSLKYGTAQDPLPEGWELVPYDNLGNFYCGTMAWMSADANFFPAALPSDGCMDLVTIDGDLSVVTATKTLLAVETGKFFDLPQVRYRKISAYRIIPRDQKDGFISIDGERIPFEPFQAEIHRGLGRVLSKRGKYEAAGPRGWESVSK